MCGRFSMAIDAEQLALDFRISHVPENWKKRYNVTPSQWIATVPFIDKPEIVFMRWGLVPFWAKDPAIGNQLINARAETVAEKSSFKASFKNKRCLILANGFYEWKKEPGSKRSIPYYFSLKSGDAFAFAGLWDDWEATALVSEPGLPGVTSCTIITTEANALVRPVHSRMPVVLTKDVMWNWLKSGSEAEKLAMLQPLDPDLMIAWQLGHDVNNPVIDNESLIKPRENNFKQRKLL